MSDSDPVARLLQRYDERKRLAEWCRAEVEQLGKASFGFGVESTTAINLRAIAAALDAPRHSGGAAREAEIALRWDEAADLYEADAKRCRRNADAAAPSHEAVRDALAEALRDLDLQEDASDAASVADEILTRIQLRLKYPVLGALDAAPPTKGREDECTWAALSAPANPLGGRF